ncbi:hypothetical protein F511_44668 [Dorcoceras hygrometricum]|uniref:Uncharacterized protein n=1 Tax=Dorcoceras hygrometricum TaxID=472368 RepID=A0A2Z6ZYS5_9LAMI|nr:hypothetical protein F511_44668 [Dorcoceras hygrometricum]
MVEHSKEEKQAAATAIHKLHVQQTLDRFEELRHEAFGTEIIHKEENNEEGQLQLDDLVMAHAQMEDSAHEVQDPLGRKFGESRQPEALKFQIPPPENPPWWKVFAADKSGIEEACRVLAQLYSLPKAQYIHVRKKGGSFTTSNQSWDSPNQSVSKDASLLGTTTNDD